MYDKNHGPCKSSSRKTSNHMNQIIIVHLTVDLKFNKVSMLLFSRRPCRETTSVPPKTTS